ncbi:hypothetical protein [Clostridium beijerinckii]|uniref:hypothetical protein n=1 Tax=Clostridium beijerinckii TaxID=1520 RepID=UPI00242AEEB6|nr:hypothetical protein [Clostridium beijerinckii]MDG5857082.1 hypothetical protein [Clostridium beijerinckii]
METSTTNPSTSDTTSTAQPTASTGTSTNNTSTNTIINSSSTDTGTTVDINPILTKMDTQIGLLYVENIFLFGILIFMAFKFAMKGLWK